MTELLLMSMRTHRYAPSIVDLSRCVNDISEPIAWQCLARLPLLTCDREDGPLATELGLVAFRVVEDGSLHVF
ncbi:hypothetical protein PUR34_08325 [Streptomyces sp. JV185]|uniref:hypothetical protein n=1 Tax=Streptomyces sp. JV185 TaxID=858638 RepID=UPI002E777230|nr:hypothetical protein [Streptomyces sp. JV185]MEE1768181.1 hypothetical protein [Streptomyces sp. JV185]